MSQWIELDYVTKAAHPEVGKEVLLYENDEVIVVGFYDAMFDSFRVNYSDMNIEPTHWMPLPEPPKQ
jgi:hypothetical protein